MNNRNRYTIISQEAESDLKRKAIEKSVRKINLKLVFASIGFLLFLIYSVFHFLHNMHNSLFAWILIIHDIGWIVLLVKLYRSNKKKHY